jgi:hypothetical protein
MPTSIPEGVYPGCIALSGLAEAGRAIVVQVPGYSSTVQAIAASPIRSPNGLTLTIDETGVARVFGVGGNQQLIRTTAFYRSIRRAIPVRLIEWLIHWTKAVLPQTGTIEPLLNDAQLPTEEFTGQLPGQRLHYRGKGTSEASTILSAEFQPSFGGAYFQAVTIAEFQSAIAFEVEASLEVTPPPPPLPPGVHCDLPPLPPCQSLDYVLVEISAPYWVGTFTPDEDEPNQTVVEEIREAFSNSFYVIYPSAVNNPPNDGRSRLIAEPQTGAPDSVCEYGDLEFELTDTIVSVQLRFLRANWYSDLNSERVRWHEPAFYGEGVLAGGSGGGGAGSQVTHGYFEYPAYTKTVNYTFHYADQIIQHGTPCYGIPTSAPYQADLLLEFGIVESVPDLPDLNNLMEDDYDSSPYVDQLMQLNKLPQFFYRLHLSKSATGDSKERFFQKESAGASTTPGISIAEPYSPEEFVKSFSPLSGEHLLIVKASLQSNAEDCSAQFKLEIQHTQQ